MVSGRIRPIEADLFSTASLREPPSSAIDPPPKAPSTTDAATAASAPRYLLPKDLRGAISNLSDQEFDRLLAAVLAEQKRRGTKLPRSGKTSRKPASKEIVPPLTLASSTLYGLPSGLVSRHHVLPDSLEFPMRTFARRWQVVRLSGHPRASWSKAQARKFAQKFFESHLVWA